MDLQALLRAVISFRDERDWAQYHNPKDLAISLALEAAELLEIFQWKSPEQVQAMKSDEQACRRVKEELGDVLIYALNLANEFTFDPAEVVLEKLAINGRKYPVEKAKGRADKYSAYEE
ncbi:MazG nucleotide pyrophosphohydrolase [uncultured Desulfatiglans sp.]|uniref:MazG nucleotide pyrophosphohydrolase n=1 Tax=Uncultured Desulfatiglans sp. TaxID=1748965 RepID=A0A653AED4_UNCDX|nr:MazG nucleotide pyrophosphohydrolase [uncultured Desulfatiglans sp.]